MSSCAGWQPALQAGCQLPQAASLPHTQEPVHTAVDVGAWAVLFYVQLSCTIVLRRRVAFETTYTSLRENLASVLDRVVADNEVAIIRRKGAKDVALLPAVELAGYIETAHLLRSPRNARRLLTALHRAQKGQGKVRSAEQLRREVGLEARR